MDKETKRLLREKYHSWSKEEQRIFLESLSTEAFNQFFYSEMVLQDYQIMPDTNWYLGLFLAGRGVGKSFFAAEWLAQKYRDGYTGLVMVGATYADLSRNMIPTFISRFPPNQRPKFLGGSSNTIKMPNGSVIHCLTLDNESSRGGNYAYCWCDEVCKACDGIPDKIEEHFDILKMSVRIGNPQILITTTPKPIPLLKKWLDRHNSGDTSIVVKHAATKDNKYLSEVARDEFYKAYGNSRFGLQELEGIVNFDIDGALWNANLINSTRKESLEIIANPPNPNNMKRYNHPFDFFQKFALGVDPATTSHANSDSWGIVVAGLGRDNHVYVIEDQSRIMSPNDAANEIEKLHRKYRNCQIIAESNQGGDMITYILRTKNPNLTPKLVHAHQNKMTRAQPICVLWDQGRGHIVGKMPKLEEEMCNYTGDPGQKSPNVLDAMVYACQYLLLEANVRPSSNGWAPNFR